MDRNQSEKILFEGSLLDISNIASYENVLIGPLNQGPNEKLNSIIFVLLTRFICISLLGYFDS
jgi:hypothetical protein